MLIVNEFICYLPKILLCSMVINPSLFEISISDKIYLCFFSSFFGINPLQDMGLRLEMAESNASRCILKITIYVPYLRRIGQLFLLEFSSCVCFHY